MYTAKKKKWTAIVAMAILFALVSSIALLGLNRSTKIAYGDAYAGYDGEEQTLTLSTDKVLRTVSLTDGKLVTTEYTDLVSNVKYVDAAAPQNEFSVEVGEYEFRGDDNSAGNWRFVDSKSSRLSQNELQITLTVTNDVIQVTKYYVVYPNTSFIQEWAEIKNISGAAVRVSSPGMFEKNFGGIDGKNSDFYYMTGNGNYSGASIMKAIPLNASYSRYFNSLDDYELQEVHGFYQDNIANKFMGVGIYNEFFAVHNRAKNYGFLQMFDYIGIWNNDVKFENGRITFDGRIAMTRKSVKNGETITTAKSLTGFWQGDMDDMGNTVVDYQYDYKWDYTEEYTTEEADWSTRQAQWVTGRQTENAFRLAQEGRQLGFSGVHIDDSWFDASGDWNETYGDDFAKINEFVKKSGSRGMTVWSPIWQTYYQSEVAKEHPDWLEEGGDRGGWIGSNGGYGSHWNFANEEVYQWALEKLTSMQEKWGSYMWRYDAEAVSYTSDGYNDMLAQSNNFYRILKAFKDANPEAGIHGCSSGGHSMTIESIRYSDKQQITDGGVGDVSGYYLSMLFPISKLEGHATVGRDDVWRRAVLPYNNASGLSPVFTDVLDGDYDESDMDVAREFNLMSKFLKESGVKGRYSKTYRPLTETGAGKEYLLQLMDGDCEKGAIFITKWDEMVGKTFTVYPKGLKADHLYTVSSWEGGVEKVTKTGAQLMSEGVKVNGLQAGETIFFNLENRPFNGTDTVAPDAPETLTVEQSEYLGFRGIELNWARATDNNFISHYNIYRNGKLVDAVYSGTFYFGLSGSIYDEWGVATVDGDGNESPVLRMTSGQTPSIDSYDYTADFSPEGNHRGWNYYSESYGTRSAFEWRSTGMYLTAGNGEQLGSNTLVMGDETVVIEWTAPRTGYVLVFGEVKKERKWSTGDGVNITLSHKYNQLYQGQLTNDNWQGITYQGATYVMKGDTVTFSFDQNASSVDDRIFFSASIRYEDINYAKQVEKIAFADDELSYAVGKEVKLPVNIYPIDATADLTFEVVSGAGLFDLSADGTILPKAAGNALVKVTCADNGRLTDTVSLTFYDEAKMFDSIRDFGTVQGYRNWYYKYFKSSNPSASGEMSWDSANQLWSGPEAFLQSTSEGGHPGGQYASVKEFVAPYSGTVSISAAYRKTSGSGNGIFFIAYQNATELYRELVSNVAERTYTQTVTVEQGDSLSFAIDANSGDTAFDTTELRIVIEYARIPALNCVQEIAIETSNGSNAIDVGETVSLIAKTVPADSETPIRWNIVSGGDCAYYDAETNTLVGVAPGTVIVQAMAQDALTAMGQAMLRVVATNEGGLFDSKEDFSFEQGKNNWYYYTSTQTGLYKEMTGSKDGSWHANSWANIGDLVMHPETATDVVRAFKAPFGGTVQMLGYARKASGGIGGNGVNLLIMVNGKTVYTKLITGSDSVGVFYDFTAELAAGDMIYLILDANGADGFDATEWRHINNYLSVSDLNYKITQFNERLAAAPSVSEVTLSDKETLEALAVSYNEFSADEKIQIRGYYKLMLALERIAELEADCESAKTVDEIIGVFLRSSDLSMSGIAYSAYNALSPAQKLLVTQYETLCEKTTALLNESAALKVERMINAIDLSKVTLNDEAQIKRLAKAYGALTEEESTYLSDEAVAKYTQMNEKIAELTDQAAAHKVIVLINSLSAKNPDQTTLNKAKFARNQLTSAQLALVGEEKLAKLQSILDGTAAEDPDDNSGHGNTDTPTQSGGCGSVMIGGMSGALILLAGAAIVLKRKK